MLEMKLFISIFVPALIIVLVRILLIMIEERSIIKSTENAKKEHVVIHLPKAFFWIGFIEFAFFICFMVFGTTFPNVFKNINIWYYLIFSCFSLLGLLLVLATKVWKIDVYENEDYFIYRSFLGNRYTVYYNDCLNYIDGNNAFILNTKLKKFYIDSFSENLELLIYQLNIHHVKKDLPKKRTK